MFLEGKDPDSNAVMYGNKNVIRHVKFQGQTRLPTIWIDWCGGGYVENCYFEPGSGNISQYARVTNGQTFTFGPNNWVQAPLSAGSCPSFHLDLQGEALIHNNSMLQGAVLPGQIEMDYHQYQAKYPNIVRMWGNGSYFPQPGNRNWLAGGKHQVWPMIPGVLVGQPNSLVLNASNNPSDWAYNSTAYPWVLDTTTQRYVVNAGDAAIAANGFGAWFRQTGRLYRTFNLLMSARKTGGAGTCAINVTYEGNATTSLGNYVLTFTTTAETSVQTSANFSIPAGETLGGSLRVNFIPSGVNVEEVLVVPVS
jgi:hypothetical protein